MNKQETYRYLDQHGISYEVTEHPAVFNMEELQEISLPYPQWDAKNLFVRDDKKQNYYLITVAGDRRVDLKQFRKQEGLRNLSFAKPEELAEFLKLTPGSVTPLGLLEDQNCRVTFYLDRYFEGHLIGVHPNDNTATVWLQSDDLIRLIRGHGNPVKTVLF